MSNKKSPEVGKTESPEVAAAALKGTEVWTDIQAYFMELFEERQDFKTITIDEPRLIAELEARFNGAYDAATIAGLLRNGFELGPGVYHFKREDFIKAKPNLGKELQDA